MKNQIIGFTVGILVIIIGVAELIPALLDYTDGHANAVDFLRCAILSIFVGGALVLSNRQRDSDINVKQTFMLTALSWLFLSLFSALPLYYSDLDLSFSDAIFESVSGVTTTGSTVLSGLDEMSRGVLLWRSITQWIGGIGIIAFAIVILPFLRIGGMQLFQTESSDRSDKIMPKTVDLVMSILIVYCALTVACILTYYTLGMDMFNAINHALTTIPTGGYSTHDASFGYYDAPALQYAAAFFMLSGSIPFVLFVKLMFQGKANFFKDEQFKSFIIILSVLILSFTAWLWFHSDFSVSTALLHSTFNIVSVITTTGFATLDYTIWGSFAVIFFLFLTYLGSCSGSTSGGIKIMRIVILAKILNRQIKTLIHPNGVFAVRYQGYSVNSALALNVMGFIGVFVVCNVFLTIALTFLGLDFQTALSGAATALANVGPGIGDTIGPSGNFSTLPDTAKWLLCAGMILGRLEIMTIFVLFRYEYWKS